MNTQLKILVTGSTGFVGEHLCRRLTELGHQVYGLARSKNKFDQKDIKAKFVEGSLSKDGELDFVNLLPDDLDVVYHTAGIVSSFDLKHFYNVNYHATENLITHLAKRYSKLNFILVSSLAAGGPKAEFESDLPQPVSHYGRSKLLAEKSLLKLAPKDWQKSTVRPPMVIGPGDQAVLDVFKMVKSKNVLIAGTKGLDNKYSFVCVFDLVELLLKLAHYKEEKINDSDIEEEEETASNTMPIFYSSHPQVIEMKELLESIKSNMNINKVFYVKFPIVLIRAFAFFLKPFSYITSQEIRLTPDKVYELEQEKWICSGSLSQEKLNFSYEWDLTKTIEVTYNDYVERGWL